MKLARLLLITLVALLVVLGLVAALALTPAVQEWVVRRALAERPDLAVQFSRLSAGPAKVELEGVSFAQDGLSVRVGRLEADYSLWRFATRRQLHVTRLTASEIVIDASALTAGEAGAGAAGGPAAAPAALASVQLPFELFVGEINLSGRASLPGPPLNPVLPATFRVTGGQFAPGAAGELLLEAAVTDDTPDARVSALKASGRLRLWQSTERRFDQVALDLLVDADGPRFAGQNQLRLAAEMTTTGVNAGYSLTIDTLRGGGTENVLKVHATQASATAPFAGDWTVQARTAQLEPFFLGGALPDFTVTGAGGFDFSPATTALRVQGKLDGSVSRLEAIDPALRPLGAIRLQSEFDLAAAGDVARIDHLRVRLDGAQPILAAEMHRALAFNRRDRQVQIGGPTTSEVGRLTLHHLPLTWVRPFVSAVDLSGDALTGELVLTNSDQQLQVRTVTPLRIGSLTIVQEGARLLDRAELAMQLEAAFMPGEVRGRVTQFSLRTPAGDEVRADVTVEAPLVAEPPVTVRGKITADLPQLLEPFLALGRVKLSGETDLTLTADTVQLRSFRGTLADGADRTLVNASGSEPFGVDLRTLQITGATGQETTLARLELGRLPLGEMPLVQAKFPLRGELAPAEFVLSATNARLFLKPSGPVRLSGLTLPVGGRPILEGVVVEILPSGEFAGLADWKFTSGATTMRNAAGTLLTTVGIEASTRPGEGLRALSTFNFDLAALGSQPGLASLSALVAGRASGEVRAALNSTGLQVEARSTLNGLVAREGNQPLPVANLSVRLVRTPEGRWTLEAPLLLDRSGQRSDLRLTAEAVQGSDGLKFDAKLAGEYLELADVAGLGGLLQALASPAESSPAPATPATTVSARATADVRPFWAGVSGALSVEVKTVARGADWQVSGLGGRVLVEPTRLALPQLEATINGKGRFGARAEMQFSPGAQPYRLAGEFSLTEFDLGALLKALEPDRPPTIEGVFVVAGTFTGQGANLDHTVERTRGQFQFTSRQGVFRGLRRTSDKVSVASKAVELGAALGSLFGSNKVKEAAEKVAGQTYQVDQLAQALAELPFDQLLIRLNRDDRLNIQLQEFNLLSPEVRLTGRGTVTHVEDRPILQQPLNVTYTLAARGKVEQTLGRLQVLDGTKDELGYARMKDPGTIGGTLSRPDPTALFVKLAEAKLGEYFTPRN